MDDSEEGRVVTIHDSSDDSSDDSADESPGFILAPRTRTNPNETGRSPLGQLGPPPEPVKVEPESSGLSRFPTKKRRGRPRKYAPDGSLLPGHALSPNPISSSAPPPVINFSAGQKEKARTVGSVKDDQWASYSGASFTPHIITVNAGEDVFTKIMSFSQEGPGAICILSANGIVSTVTIRQPESSGGTLTYQGQFEILSLNGSFAPSENGGVNIRSGGMSVSLVRSDGSVVGGGVSGLLIAATPIQIVIGSFQPPDQNEHTLKLLKTASTSSQH